jgi:hypothetical protein
MRSEILTPGFKIAALKITLPFMQFSLQEAWLSYPGFFNSLSHAANMKV